MKLAETENKKNFTFLLKHKRKREKVSYSFPDKEVKFSNLKYFLIIIIKSFFPFHNIFFVTQPFYFFIL